MLSKDATRARGLKVLAIHAVHPLPSLHFRTPHLHAILGPWVVLTPPIRTWGRLSTSSACLSFFWAWLEPGHGECIALHHYIHEQSVIWRVAELLAESSSSDHMTDVKLSRLICTPTK